MKKVKRQPTKWEKIFTIMYLIKQICTLQLNSKATNDPVKNRAKDLNRHFSKEDIQMANKDMKKCFISHKGKEIQQYNTILLHTCQDGSNQKDRYNKCWQGCGEIKYLGTLLLEMRNSAALVEGGLTIPQKIKH